jgi:group I intron endonuclease
MPYKDKIQGIYKIQSISHPDRIYVGSAISIFNRWSDHRKTLAKNKHTNPKLQYHYNKYGLNDLNFEIIESQDYIDNNHLLAREQIWMIRLRHGNTWIPYFNINLIAGNRKDCVLSDESKAKLSKSLTGKKWKDEEREMRIASMTGVKKSDETRKRMSKAMIGNKKGLGKVPWNKGIKGVYHHSEEACAKISERMTGANHPQFGKPAWNKGLTKNTDERIAKGAEKSKQTKKHLK